MDDNPFDSFITETYEKRLQAKSKGNQAMVFIYKILMNPLYGRFGINPQSSVTEVCEKARYDELIGKGNFNYARPLSEKYYIVNYIANPSDAPDEDWDPPRLSAAQISAAITACARIHMYKYISRDDCYYTDTDSAVLGSPLPEEEISSTILGKLKLEDKILTGIFLASKSYYYKNDKGEKVIKHKGRAHDQVDDEWFESQYKDTERKEKRIIEDYFNKSWNNIEILKKNIHVNLHIKITDKRELVYNNQHKWIDTRPKEVTHYGHKPSQINKIVNLIINEKDDKIKDLEKQIRESVREKRRPQLIGVAL